MTGFEEFILKGDFNSAYNLIDTMKAREISEKLIANSIFDKNLLIYGFVAYALLRKETIALHSIAIDILTNAYTDVEGAYELAYCHVKRQLELDNTSFEALSNMMFLSAFPDTSGTQEDFNWAKERIAELYPNDSILKVEYGEGMKPEDVKKSKMAEFDND